jgi:hypothetical protein
VAEARVVKTFPDERPGARWEHRETGEVWVVTEAHRPLDMRMVTHLTLRREGGDEVMYRWRAGHVWEDFDFIREET